MTPDATDATSLEIDEIDTIETEPDAANAYRVSPPTGLKASRVYWVGKLLFRSLVLLEGILLITFVLAWFWPRTPSVVEELFTTFAASVEVGVMPAVLYEPSVVAAVGGLSAGVMVGYGAVGVWKYSRYVRSAQLLTIEKDGRSVVVPIEVLRERGQFKKVKS